jgi:hypothetical protein
MKDTHTAVVEQRAMLVASGLGPWARGAAMAMWFAARSGASSSRDQETWGACCGGSGRRAYSPAGESDRVEQNSCWRWRRRSLEDGGSAGVATRGGKM